MIRFIFIFIFFEVIINFKNNIRETPNIYLFKFIYNLALNKASNINRIYFLYFFKLFE